MVVTEHAARLILEKKHMKKHGNILIAAALISAMALASCRKDPEATAGKKEFSTFSYVAAEADERLVTGLAGDRLYYVQHTASGYELYASDMDTGQQEKIYGESDGSEPPHVSMLAAASNNQAALLKIKGGQADGSASDRKYSVVVFKPDGAVQAEYDVTAYLTGEARLKSMLTDPLGNVYLVLGEKLGWENARILVFDAAGKLAHTFTPESDEALQQPVS